MKSVNKLFLLFLLIIVIIFSYSYIIGKDLATLQYQGLNDITEVLTALSSAGAEGDDPKVLNMNTVYENNVDTFDPLFEKSDLIVECVLKDRTQKINVITSEVEVSKVWKGDNNITNQTIPVYEPFGFTKENAIYIFGACLPMREKETYLLFLKEEANGSYNLVSGLYGKYNMKGDVYYQSDGSDITMDMINQSDMFEYVLSEETKQRLEEQMKLGGVDTEFAKEEMDSYEILINLKGKREEIRKMFLRFMEQ